jgi:transcriptional regulator with PAS, ATPase and Fis domain
VRGVGRSIPSFDIAGVAWEPVLHHLSEAVLVIDCERTLRFVNERARRLLGLGPGEAIGERCRLVTRGIDCETACPVTYALQHGLAVVEDFAAEYRGRDGAAVAVRVTVVPLRDRDGGLAGHVEILRPCDPEPGFYLAGHSPRVTELRRRLAHTARSGRHLILVGAGVACLDVARAVHRFSGLPPELFHTWPGSWARLPAWPPGTVFVDGGEVDLVLAGAPAGWRVVVAAAAATPSAPPDGVDVVELPTLQQCREDLPAMVRAWVEQLAPGLEVAPAALERLCRLGAERGLEVLQGSLLVAVAAADGRIEETHLPAYRDGAELLHTLLERQDPLAALEETLLREVLERCGWKMQDAAERLGISRVTLWRKLREHGIEK